MFALLQWFHDMPVLNFKRKSNCLDYDRELDKEPKVYGNRFKRARLTHLPALSKDNSIPVCGNWTKFCVSVVDFFVIQHIEVPRVEERSLLQQASFSLFHFRLPLW